MHEISDAGKEGWGTGEILGRRDKKGGMQDRRDAEQERCCTGEIGKVGCRTGGMKAGGMHEIRDTGKEGYKKGEMQDRWDARLGKT